MNVMENDCHKYAQQLAKANETLRSLQTDLNNIRQTLKNNPTSAEGLRTLKQLTLDMTITLNEVEHSQYQLEQCRSATAKMEERYND